MQRPKQDSYNALPRVSHKIEFVFASLTLICKISHVSLLTRFVVYIASFIAYGKVVWDLLNGLTCLPFVLSLGPSFFVSSNPQLSRQ